MNQFSVQPLGGFNIVGAAGNALNDYRAKQGAEAQQLKKQEISNQAVALMEANDAAGMAELMLRNPEMKAAIDAAQGYKNETTKGYRRDALMRIISGEDHTSVAEETAMKIEAAGGIADHTRSYAALPKDQALSMAKMELAGMDPNAYKAYAQSQSGGSDLPSAVKETEWFLRQPEDVQKKHIELKRKTDPTLAEKLQFELDKTEVVGEARNKVNESAAARKQAKSNAQGLRVYEAAISKFADAVDANAGGTISGLLPTITDNRKVLDGATKVMAPVLKDIFRQSGEGTFTKDDQDMLLGMLPGPKDGPSVAAKKLDMVDTIVKEKLGAPLQDEAVAEEVIIRAHPKYGDVTESDIQQTMSDTGMTREEIIVRLQGG